MKSMKQSISRNELIEIIKEILREMNEASTTANVPGYQTPYAFSGGLAKNKKKKKDLIKRLHMKLVGKLDESSLNEGRYHEYRNDETRTPKQKIWHSVREVRDSLMKLERNLKHAIKLKNEQGMDSRTYYKYAKNSFPKIQEKLIKMAKRIGELSA
jgi:hypothetical protein|tara:strand:- start:407 stop:874 length:468 start_codon:yes stop_codon:yes gene_type:complete